jgi:hypothetical protein
MRNDKEFLLWVHGRLQHVHGEDPNYDYMIRLLSIANEMPSLPAATKPWKTLANEMSPGAQKEAMDKCEAHLADIAKNDAAPGGISE